MPPHTYVGRSIFLLKKPLCCLVIILLMVKIIFLSISIVLFASFSSSSPPHLFVCTVLVIALMENGFLQRNKTLFGYHLFSSCSCMSNEEMFCVSLALCGGVSCVLAKAKRTLGKNNNNNNSNDKATLVMT